jgi:predicted DNA-binding transcriptional regulator AlpA
MNRKLVTREVTEMTMLSLPTIMSKVKENTFPKPVGKTSAITKAGYPTHVWDADDVNQWLRENRSYFYTEKAVQFTVSFTKEEWEHIKSASKDLLCEEERFIRVAATNKANLVLDVVQNGGHFKPSLLEVS